MYSNIIMNNLPVEILEKIYLYAHPTLDKQLQLDIHNFKFKLINEWLLQYNIKRIMGGMNGICFI